MATTTRESKIRLGSAGNSEAFYAEGYKSTKQAAHWLNDLGLSAFEYPAGRGIRISESSANDIAVEMRKNDIAVSLHAPYFINLAIEDEERIEKNIKYFLESAEAARNLGADRVIFHPGSTSKMKREKALELAKNLFTKILTTLDEAGYSDIAFCPETMGKQGQLGDLYEVLALCKLRDTVIPAIDFGHLHARDCGAIKSIHDYEKIISTMIDEIGFERTRDMHVHFSRIEYSAKGEKKHHTFADTEHGPDFEPLAQVIANMELKPRIICESAGTQALDALYMKQCPIDQKAMI